MIEPQSRCERPGCKNWAEPFSKTCREHQSQRKKEKDAMRNKWNGNAADRGYDSVWSNLAAIVRKEEPLCQNCLKHGIIKDTDVADHIVPIQVRPDLRLVRSNLQGLCYACNSEKMIEDIRKYPTFYNTNSMNDKPKDESTTPIWREATTNSCKPEQQNKPVTDRINATVKKLEKR